MKNLSCSLFIPLDVKLLHIHLTFPASSFNSAFVVVVELFHIAGLVGLCFIPIIKYIQLNGMW